MRFSYIDSQGKEIEVDSIESLALRIELGAVQPDTRMYDAVADRWAPAEEHPVYRSLSRGEEVTEDDIVPIGAREEAEDEAAGDAEAVAEEAEKPPVGEELEEPVAEAEEAGPDDAEAEEEADVEEEAEGEEAAAPAGDSDDPLGLDFQVSMAEDEEGEGAEEEGAEEDDEGIPDFDLGGVELEEAEEEEAELEEAEHEEAALDGEPEAGDEPEAREDGPFEQTLEPEESFEPEGAEGWAGGGEAAIWDEGPEEPDGDQLAGEEAGGEEATGEPEPAGGAELGPQDGGPGDLPPWAQDAPAWDDEEDATEPAAAGAETGGPAREHGGSEEPGPEAAGGGEGPEDGKRAVPERPAHWDERARARERKQRLKKLGLTGLAVAVVGGGVAWLAGVGGFGPGAPDAGGEEAEATSPIPVLPTELREVLDEAGDAAWASAVARAMDEASPSGVAAEPPEEWLQGHYLSNAGEYPAVGEYWRTMADFASDARSAAEGGFSETLRAQLEEAAEGSESEVAGEVSRLHEIGVRELELSAARRDSAVGRVREVAVAAVELHGLLVDRQEEIAYEPYSAPGVSRDPVLEAVPETQALQAEMNERLDRVLAAIEESRLSRPITTSGLVELVEDQLRRAGWEYREPQAAPPEG